jgi:hypothetical protein
MVFSFAVVKTLPGKIVGTKRSIRMQLTIPERAWYARPRHNKTNTAKSPTGTVGEVVESSTRMDAAFRMGGGDAALGPVSGF